LSRPIHSVALKDVYESMPPVLRPGADDLDDRAAGPTPVLSWFRVSAFPKYATTFDELDELLAVSRSSLAEFRRRFCRFIESIVSSEPCYSHCRRPYADKASRIISRQNKIQKLAIALAERDAADIFIPRKGVLLAGHDDFGCNCYCALSPSSAAKWIEERANEVGLYCVKPPGR
jgi:hypothetical protein